MEPHEFAHLSLEEKKALFTAATITHRQLEVVHDKILRAVRQPAGFSFVLVHGPTGVGKTRMMESLAGQVRDLLLQPRSHTSSLSLAPYGLSPVPIPVLVIEADPPDKSAFNRGYFYRTVLTLLGEQTYPELSHVDIHAEAAPPKRRRMSRAATESNDVPELREGAQAAMYRHGVRVIFLDEAHHLLMGRSGTQGSTLQEQLEWLKSLGSKTGVLYVLVGTYDLFNFGKLNGQIVRRCLPVHFPRYQLEREVDCVEFQSALLELLRRMPLTCEAERWVTDHWLYFYECSVGCIGVLKDWLLRAVSTALDDGLTRLSLDCVQDHALPVDIYRQMALDAYEGEQKLNHTASNREHVWRLLQGGELIAPVPPLPPRETPPEMSADLALGTPPPSGGTEPVSETPVTNVEAAPPPPVKKTRARKKVEALEPSQESGSMVQAESEETPLAAPSKRGRKKKTADPAGTAVETEVKITPEPRGNAPQASTDSETDVIFPRFDRVPKAEIYLIKSGKGSSWERYKKPTHENSKRKQSGWFKPVESLSRRLPASWASPIQPFMDGGRN
ncbi:MAG TPA: AAA family ATPase [Ktedonobacteraceae bacterium]|nr:AAA family ATPase [Ktedonobacteraceae bacterium]